MIFSAICYPLAEIVAHKRQAAEAPVNGNATATATKSQSVSPRDQPMPLSLDTTDMRPGIQDCDPLGVYAGFLQRRRVLLPQRGGMLVVPHSNFLRVWPPALFFLKRGPPPANQGRKPCQRPATTSDTTAVTGQAAPLEGSARCVVHKTQRGSSGLARCQGLSDFETTFPTLQAPSAPIVEGLPEAQRPPV